MHKVYTHSTAESQPLSVHCFTVNSFYQNSYMVHGWSGEAILIDAGCASHAERKELTSKISDLGLTIRAILLTHSHIDHVMGLAWAQQQFNCPIYQHPDDAQNLRSAVLFGEAYGFGTLPLPDQATIKYINDNESFSLGKLEFKALFTPGHSKGHLAFYVEKAGVCFTGDALFHESIGRTDLPGGNYAQLISSIKTRLLTLPEKTIIYPGHMEPSMIGHENKANPFLVG